MSKMIVAVKFLDVLDQTSEIRDHKSLAKYRNVDNLIACLKLTKSYLNTDQGEHLLDYIDEMLQKAEGK